MGMNVTQKALLSVIEDESAAPGDLIFPAYTLAYGTERTLSSAAGVLQEMDFAQPADPARVLAISTQYLPSAGNLHGKRERRLREAVDRLRLERYYPAGRGGVAPIHLAQHGLAVSGDIVIGGDIHAAALGAIGVLSFPVGSTDLAVALALGKFWVHLPEAVRVTFQGTPDQLVTGKDFGLLMLRETEQSRIAGRAIEFDGDAIAELSPSGRFTLAEMALDAGGTNGIMVPDDKILEFLAGSATREARYYFPDDDAEYAEEIEMDVDRLTPMVHELSDSRNIYSIEAVEADIPVHQVIIGGCSGGQMEDLLTVAKVMKYREIPDHVRLHLIPATTGVYREMINGGLASIFAELGAIIWPPGCNLCPDSTFHGIAPGENVVTTGRGRRLRDNNRVWSTGVAVAAASAVTGHLTDPRELVTETGDGEPPPDVNIQEFMSG